MTNRDFDQDDARELAEFCGYKVEGDLVFDEGDVLCRISESFTGGSWKPWSLEAPMWQIKSLLDAVREKGLEDGFMEELTERLDYEKETGAWIEPEYSSDYIEIASASPSAVCRAILSLEGE